MINPNKFHSVEKTIITMEGESSSITTKVVIKKIDADGNVSVLYEIDRIPKSRTNETNGIGHPHEIKYHDPKNQADPKVPIHWTEPIIEIDSYINLLRHYYKRGRVKNGKYMSTIDGLFHNKLTYKQAKAILRFENRASRVLAHQSKAVREIDPTKIIGYIQLDKYILESWHMGIYKKHYTTITNDEEIYKWIKTMIKKYP